MDNFDTNMEESSLEWLEFITKLNYCYKNKLPKADSNVIKCVDYWKDLNSKLIGKDYQLKNSISSFHASESSNFRYGLTDELYKYLIDAMH